MMYALVLTIYIIAAVEAAVEAVVPKEHFISPLFKKGKGRDLELD